MTTLLVVAKAPVPGQVKTRLGAHVGMSAAAELAAASLHDTVEAGSSTGWTCHLSLSGDLDAAVDGEALRLALSGWTIHPQLGRDLGARLADAHRRTPGPVVQIGMDTPHVTAARLMDVAAGLDDHDAVIGPAEDGGWWALALRNPVHARALEGVPMSTPTTGADTRAALEASGLSVTEGPVMRDVDTVADAEHVAQLAPESRFASVWLSRYDRSAS
jgi:rSAM/selenodomain-associated transferase 1